MIPYLTDVGAVAGDGRNRIQNVLARLVVAQADQRAGDNGMVVAGGHGTKRDLHARPNHAAVMLRQHGADQREVAALDLRTLGAQRLGRVKIPLC
jgi:hypothetical protein